MRNVISFHRNTENVYIYISARTQYIIHHMLFIQSASRHLCVFMNLILLLWIFFFLHMKRSWNLCISHVLKWQNDGAQLYLLSDVTHTHTRTQTQFHTFATLNGLFLSAILFIVLVVVWNERIFFSSAIWMNPHTIQIRIHVVDILCWSCFFFYMECGF